MNNPTAVSYTHLQGSQHEGVSPEAVLKELLYQLPEEFVRLFTLVGMKFHLSLRRSRSK